MNGWQVYISEKLRNIAGNLINPATSDNQTNWDQKTLILNWTWNTISSNNPLETKDVDSSHRVSLNSIFWDKIIWSRTPSLWVQFQYPLESTKSTTTLTGSATVLQENSLLKLRTWAAINSKAVIQWVNYVRYIPGHEWYVMFTTVFSTWVAGSRQIAWLYDWVDWFAIWYEWTWFKLLRYRAWVIYSQDITWIPFEWYNPTKWNVYKISFWYLGFATIHYEVMNPLWEWKVLWEINYPNTETVTHILQTFLPLRTEIENTTNNTNLELRLGSATAWVVDWNIEVGGINDPLARIFAIQWPTKTAAAGTIIGFRNMVNFGWRANRIPSIFKFLSASTDGTKNVKVKVLINPSILSATWSNFHSDSIMEVSTNVILNTGAENWQCLLAWEMWKNDKIFEDITNQIIKLRPNEVAVFYFSSTASTDISASVRWVELF